MPDDEIVSFVVPAALDGERLDRVVALATERSRNEVGVLIDEGAVMLGGHVERQRSRRVVAGDELEVALPPVEAFELVGESDVDVDVVYEDADVIVVDKPAGMVVHPGSGRTSGTLVHGLLARFPEIATVGDPNRPGIVHRLDGGTSGLLVVARSVVAYQSLVAMFAARSVHRQYRAYAWGVLSPRRGTVDAPIGRSPRNRTKMDVVMGGREARTNYEVVGEFHEPAAACELIATLETGRTHQIRVHLASIGHPVVGDGLYGGARRGVDGQRPFLHAERLELRHPVTGDDLAFQSPLPADLVALQARFA